MRLYGVTGRKNAGKTTLVERLVRELTGRGLTVSTIKHAHHTTDIDQPGRDSHRHREAGAGEVLLVSAARWALMHENRDAPEPSLADLAPKLGPCDLVLVEGYKGEAHPKLEAYRAVLGKPPLAHENPTIRALASDAPVEGLALTRLDLDDIPAIADFVLREVGLGPKDAPSPTDSCFTPSSMPAGVDWMPVDEALNRLRMAIEPVVEAETVPLATARGRILAADMAALRSNPPQPNAAVDGYGFAHATLGNRRSLPLAEGRAAAGQPFRGAVPPGQAVRILTGAVLPDGVDTVILQENVTAEDGAIAFEHPPKPGANTRRAGEDVEAGAEALAAERRLRAPDLALLAALGHGAVSVRRRLRVGVLSTGDEIVAEAGAPAAPHQIWDANRPMLLALIEGWGHGPVDLGHVGDDPAAIAHRLDEGAGRADAVLVSGGASAGDEDHVSRLLQERGDLVSWRIAMKPGRPLALATWNEVPVFGLPGNPVAALVCALVFARPALSALAGGGWLEAPGVTVPAAFRKAKRPGRREYLRARLDAEGRAEVFPSEGSGRISGIAWATGLVELPDGALDVEPGMPVRYLSFAELGL